MEKNQQSVVRVGIAVFLFNKKDEFLIGKRVKEQQFQLPGGHLEMYETFEQCAARELQEETTISIDPQEFKFIATKNVINKEQGRHYVDLVMLAKFPEDQIVKNNEIDKCEGWKWVNCNEMMKIEKNLVFDALYEFISQYKNGDEMLAELKKFL